MNNYGIGPIADLTEDVVNRTILPEYLRAGSVFILENYTYYIMDRDNDHCTFLVKIKRKWNTDKITWLTFKDRLSDHEGLVADFLVY